MKKLYAKNSRDLISVLPIEAEMIRYCDEKGCTIACERCKYDDNLCADFLIAHNITPNAYSLIYPTINMDKLLQCNNYRKMNGFPLKRRYRK